MMSSSLVKSSKQIEQVSKATLFSGSNFYLASFLKKFGGAGIQLGLWALLTAKNMTGSIMQMHVPRQQHLSISK